MADTSGGHVAALPDPRRGDQRNLARTGPSAPPSSTDYISQRSRERASGDWLRPTANTTARALTDQSQPQGGSSARRLVWGTNCLHPEVSCPCGQRAWPVSAHVVHSAVLRSSRAACPALAGAALSGTLRRLPRCASRLRRSCRRGGMSPPQQERTPSGNTRPSLGCHAFRLVLCAPGRLVVLSFPATPRKVLASRRAAPVGSGSTHVSPLLRPRTPGPCLPAPRQSPAGLQSRPAAPRPCPPASLPPRPHPVPARGHLFLPWQTGRHLLNTYLSSCWENTLRTSE